MLLPIFLLAIGGVSCVDASGVAYIANGGVPGALTMVDTGTAASLATLTNVGDSPRGIATSPDGETAYVLGKQVGKPFSPAIVTVLRSRDRQVVKVLELPGAGQQIAITPSGGMLYVSNFERREVYELDAVTGAVRKTINVATNPASISVTNDGKYLLVGSANKLQILDPAVPTVVKTISTDGEVTGSGSSPDGSMIYTIETRGSEVPGVFASSPVRQWP